MKNGLLSPLIFFCSVAGAQITRMPTAFFYTGLTAYSHQFRDAFSFTANQASLAAAKNFEAGVYSERRFLLKELTASSVAFVLPTAAGNFGAKGDYAGEPAYNESSLGFAYAKNLGRRAAVGVQFNYVAIKAAGYGTASTLNFDLGALFYLTPELTAGCHVYNPIAKRWGKDGTEKLPYRYAAGVGYDASPQVYLGVQAEKAEGENIGINGALHYLVADKLILRLGMQSATATYCFGFGVQLKRIRLDATVSLHPYLGTTPGLLLLYSTHE